MSNPQDWIHCPDCGSEDAGIIDWRPDDDTTLVCPDCGARTAAAYCGDDVATEVYGDE